MITFAQYLAEYIAEEINRGLMPDKIDSFFVQKAIEAYNSVAADC